MSVTYCDRIMHEIGRIRDLQRITCNATADGMQGVFFHHYDNRFYKVTITPYYDVKERDVKAARDSDSAAE